MHTYMCIHTCTYVNNTIRHTFVPTCTGHTRREKKIRLRFGYFRVELSSPPPPPPPSNKKFKDLQHFKLGPVGNCTWLVNDFREKRVRFCFELAKMFIGRMVGCNISRSRNSFEACCRSSCKKSFSLLSFDPCSVE